VEDRGHTEVHGQKIQLKQGLPVTAFMVPKTCNYISSNTNMWNIYFLQQ